MVPPLIHPGNSLNSGSSGAFQPKVGLFNSFKEGYKYICTSTSKDIRYYALVYKLFVKFADIKLHLF